MWVKNPQKQAKTEMLKERAAEDHPRRLVRPSLQQCPADTVGVAMPKEGLCTERANGRASANIRGQLSPTGEKLFNHHSHDNR